jgi:hypothetical protein
MTEAAETTQCVLWEGDDDFEDAHERFLDEIYGNTWLERSLKEIADTAWEFFEEIPHPPEKPGKELTASAIYGCRQMVENLQSGEASLSWAMNLEETEIKRLEEELSKRKERLERLEFQRSQMDQQVAEFGCRQYHLEQHMRDLQDGEPSGEKYNEEETTSDANSTQESDEEGSNEDDEEPDEDGGEEYDEESDEGYDEAEHEAEHEAERKRLLDEQHAVDTGQIEIYYEPIPDRLGRVGKKIRYL